MKVRQLKDDSLVARALMGLAGMVFRRRRLFVYPQVVLFVVSILITVKYPGLDFDLRRDDLVGTNEEVPPEFSPL